MKKDSQKAEEKILFFDDTVDIGKEPLPITDPKIKSIIDQYVNDVK